MNDFALYGVGVLKDFGIEIFEEGAGDFGEVGLLAEFGKVDEDDFGLEGLLVDIFHGLKIEVITEVAAGIFGNNRVEPGRREAARELREIDFGMVGDAIVAADRLEANSGEERGAFGCFWRFLVAKHFALAKKNDEVVSVGGKFVAKSSRGGLEAIFEIELVVRRAVDAIKQGFTGIGGTSEGREQGSHENIITQMTLAASKLRRAMVLQ